MVGACLLLLACLRAAAVAACLPVVAYLPGLELDDFISGPCELLLKFVEESYPLPPKPDSLPELQGRRRVILASQICCFGVVNVWSISSFFMGKRICKALGGGVIFAAQ
ncbi:hypothetical protein IFM89_013118 [Coptis chinensis]|uniref:Uncharacterized protein n=1 Tax=Coptis chinensis TaxID=261450 RepID=A0A835ME72_9MAGN|nr:hypothetical protein IFM89_013118 [Coptis chinensis]